MGVRTNMKIRIVTHEELEAERTKLLCEAVEVIKKQERSCARFALKLAIIRNKVRVLEKKLGA